MPEYLFTARTSEGESYSGTREAKNTHELAVALRQEGYVLVKASLAEDKKRKRKTDFSLPFLNKVSLKEKLFFTRNLQVMISSGLSLPRSLSILSGQVKNKKFSKAIADINEQVVKGKSFSETLSDHPDVFSDLFQSMVRVGEETGTLEDVLKVMTFQMERESELKSKLMAATLYPAVVILAMIGIGILMLVMVVPRLAETFADLDVELPLTTQLVIGLGSFAAEKWYLIVLIFIVLFVLLRFASKTKTGKRFLDSLFLKIPILSSIIKKVNSAHTTRTLSSLITAGVPIVRSLEIVSDSLGNIFFKKAIKETSEKVRKGEKLSEAIRPYDDIYPDLVFQMVEVGEETGETSVVLSKLAEFFEEEVTRSTKNLASIVEPILILVVGIVVGFFAVSMVQPMYSMLGAM